MEEVNAEGTQKSSAAEPKAEIDMAALKEACPAFMDGCPYAKMDNEKTLEELKSLNEFQEGCVFKDSKNLQDLHAQIEKMSEGEDKEKTSKLLLEAVKHVHDVSQQLKSDMGQCPVFAGPRGCPFKTVCSDGQLLLEKLEFKQWAQMIQSNAKDLIREVEDDLDILLSKELKEGTKKIHRDAEQSQFMKDIIRSKVKKEVYKTFVANLYFVYKALEDVGAVHREHELYGQIAFPEELNRVDCLSEDLKHYFGDNWKETIEPTPATKNYVSRIKQVADEDPTLLIPHHYTRYLGDLSGGQILKKKVVKGLELPEGKGIMFYEFEKIPDPTEFKNLYRTTLDKLEVNKEIADKIVEEANIAFQLNIDMFAELDKLHVKQEALPSKPKEDAPINPPAQEPSRVPTVAQKTDQSDGISVILAVFMVLVAVMIGYFMGLSQK